MKTRKVEVYLGYIDHTWDTKIIEIPENTQGMLLESVAELEAIKLFFDNPNIHDEVAFVGIYNSEIDSEEEQL